MIGFVHGFALSAMLIGAEPMNPVPPRYSNEQREAQIQPDSATAQVAVPRVFANAALVPEDVSLYIHVEDAKSLYDQIRRRPIAKWLTAQVTEGLFEHAWQGLAKSMQMEPSDLFEKLLGRSVTLVVRNSDAGSDADGRGAPGDDEWAVMTSIDEPVAKDLLKRMHVMLDLFGPCELPEQELLIQCDPNGMIIGPKRRRGLFDELCKRRDELKPAHSLAQSSAMQSVRELGEGSVGILVRHAQPVGGWSAAVASLSGDEVSVRHIGKFHNAPFKGDVTRTQGDYSTIKKLESDHMVVMAEPIDKGDGLVEHFVMQTTGEHMLSDVLKAKLSDRRITAIGETEGGDKTQENAADLVIVTALELSTTKDAEAELNERMRELAQRIRSQAEGSLLTQASMMHPAAMNPNADIDVAEAMNNGLTGGFPVMKSAKLAWCVMEASDGKWLVVASNRKSLDEFCGDLSKPTVPSAELMGKYETVGSINGVRLGRHLRGFADEAAMFVGATSESDLQKALDEFSDLAEGVGTCRWQMSRPDVNEMKLEMQIQLTPALSAEGEE
ncbi:MAG TPA: hypothetical protein VG711_07430 [Phycisphaerales bacterium]|nr:hypothetical protein [Phycisphaerales bacterium]